MKALNLLSPVQKQALQARIFYALLERLMITLVLCILGISAVLLFLHGQLNAHLAGIRARQLLSGEYLKTNNDIRVQNALLGRVEELQSGFVPLSALLQDVAARTPDGIVLSGIDYAAETQLLTIVGTADTRDRLLSYEAELRGSPFVASLDSPISNLFQRTAVSFQFKATIDPARLAASQAAPL